MGSKNSTKSSDDFRKGLKPYTDFLSKERENIWRTAPSRNSSERGSTSGSTSFIQESEPNNCIKFPCYCAKKEGISTISSVPNEVKIIRWTTK
jgi:hypothetical protein